ncbi:hypothetical protein TNCV_68261 [Trichonephila clavipes]|nr:hypothetical protein TNCV_68261 [Trichonephila clavipes]
MTSPSSPGAPPGRRAIHVKYAVSQSPNDVGEWKFGELTPERNEAPTEGEALDPGPIGTCPKTSLDWGGSSIKDLV